MANEVIWLPLGMPYSLKALILVALLFLSSRSSYAQDFFKDYRKQVKQNPYKGYRKSKLRSLMLTQKGFKLFEEQTKTSVLNRDTVFIVDLYFVETAGREAIIWNRSVSFSFLKYPKKALSLEDSAKKYLDEFKPSFKHWVETGDTSAYNKYGRQASWYDAPGISFTVATKVNGHWRFITSGSFSNNIDKLDGR